MRKLKTTGRRRKRHAKHTQLHTCACRTLRVENGSALPMGGPASPKLHAQAEESDIAKRRSTILGRSAHPPGGGWGGGKAQEDREEKPPLQSNFRAPECSYRLLAQLFPSHKSQPLLMKAGSHRTVGWLVSDGLKSIEALIALDSCALSMPTPSTREYLC